MTYLTDMHVMFVIMHKAHELFDKMQQRYTTSLNLMIKIYAQVGLLKEVEILFKEM